MGSSARYRWLGSTARNRTVVPGTRPFDVASYDPSTQAIAYTGPAVSALPNENGRKDTVQAHPGEVTRIRARFELPDEGTIELPPGVANPQYVWHCHILEHEENDMMRAFEVVQ